MWKNLLLITALWLFSYQVSTAQSRIVQGQITSIEDDAPLAGVNVVIKGSSQGTITDIDGQYTLSIPSGTTTLVFSYVGFVSEEVQVLPEQSTLNFSLSPDLQSLSEIVVTAFGVKQEKRALGYAVQEIKPNLITETNQPNAINALRGRIAGVNITSSSGAPGAGTSIIIRGINSLNPGADNQPLFVIDGIPISNQTDITGGRGGSNFTNTNRFADINPDDIASITVLKGPAASALYGLRAANGAVIITTKTGSAGKAKFDFRTSYSFDDVVKRPPMQKKYGQGLGGVFNPNTYHSDGPLNREGLPVYDQWDQIFNTGNQFQNAFTMSGGTDKATYYSSISRLDQTGVIPNSDYARTTVKLAGSLKATDNITIDASASYINAGGTNPRAGIGGAGVMSYASRYANTIDMTNYINPDGSQIRYVPALDNPFYFAENAFQNDNVDRFIGMIGVNAKLLEWLTIDYRAGIDQYTDTREIITSPGLLISPTGSISQQIVGYRELNSNFIATAEHRFGQHFNGSLSLGNQITNIATTNLTGTGTNFVIPTFESINNLNNYTVRSFPTERNIIGFFADMKLDYKQTVFLNVTGRNDLSSTLPSENRSFFYPSVSLGYVFTETLGLSTNSIFNYGKVRLSYAEVGKDASPYQIGRYFETLAPFRETVGVRRSTNFGSLDLRPERTKGTEFGLELNFFENRLNIDANYAIQTSVDQIVPIPVSLATGYNTFLANAGEVRNNIAELVISGDIIRRNGFTWSTILNWSRLRGEVLSMPEGVEEIVFQPESPWVKQKIRPGGRPGDWYGWELSRVDDPSSQFAGRYVIGSTGYPDVNDNWKGRALAEDDHIGNAFPDWEGGINNALSYKGLEFSFLFTFRRGGQVFDINRRMRYGAAGGEAPTGTETDMRNKLVIFDGVRNTGSVENPVWIENDIPAEINVQTLYQQAFRYRLAREFNGFQDASWLRLQNVSLSYTLPEGLVSKTPFTKIRASVTGNNLWLTTPFVGFDPEQSAYGPGSNVIGYVGTNVPATRSIYIGLNVSF